jgi:hypothetical protein
VELVRPDVRSLIVPLLLAAWIGSVSGTLLVGMANAALTEPSFVTVEAAIGALVLAHVVVLPLTAIALAVLGIPMAFGLQAHSREPWLALVAVAAGGIFGRLITRMLDMDRFSPALPGFLEYGASVGALTGLCWFLFSRDLFHPTTED